MSEALQKRGIPTMFGEVFHNRVSFCIDTSGSMYNYIDVVKDHLIETLSKHANKDRETMFNVVEFNSGVTKWADKMVTCTPETVGVAAEWIRNLSAKTGTNTQDALLAAFSDRDCEAVYLVTDSLPDQYPDDVIDETVNVCEERPVHCIYVSDEKPDERTVDFLEDLAVDTFGSLHIVSITRHGCVERITPIYRADHAHEKIIRTVNGKILPNIKNCSVSTTLNTNPEDSLYLASRYYNSQGYPLAPYSPFWWLNPHRYYYPNIWSRYRPAKSWLKQQQDILDSTDQKLSPSAGALLIGKRVLARRIEDGYFYFGTVRSQLLFDKFLVAFGPCKHGKYKDTTYQETYVYDIISYEDAKRHAILAEDKVLATFEAYGEKFSPGVVLEGQEKRDLEGPEDEQLIVSFFDGKSSAIPSNSAVWIPEQVYERLALELKMPKAAREALQQQNTYPKESLPGYPTSGAVAVPDAYQLADPISLEFEPVYTDPGFYVYPRTIPTHMPYPPVIYKMDPPKAPPQTYSVKSEDMNALIPGTELTRKELEDKVMSQLMENTNLLENKKTETPVIEEVELVEEIARNEEPQPATETYRETKESERLLSKREKQDENFLRKSVSFKDEAEYFDQKNRASPHLSRSVEFDSTPNRDMAVNTDYRLFERKIPPMRKRPEWKSYWASGGIPDIIEPNTYEPFRETASQAPLEARDRNRENYYGNWTSPLYNVVDSFARSNYDNSMEQLMRPPKPPNYSPDKQGPGNEIGYQLGSGDVTDEQREAARREYRRRQMAQRQQEWDRRMREQETQSTQMYEQQKQKIVDQIVVEKTRQENEQKQIQEAQLAKQHIRLELKSKRERDRKEEQGRDQRRIEAMRQRRQRREMAQANKLMEQESEQERREAYKQERSQARWNEHHKKLLEQDLQNAASDQQKHEAKVKRIEHFRKKKKVPTATLR